MFMFFTVGMTDYPKRLKEFENHKFYCPRCHNMSMEAKKERKFFTFCFIPLIPFSFAKILQCPICGYQQDTSKEQLEMMKNQQQGQGQDQHQGQRQQYHQGQGNDGKTRHQTPSSQHSQPPQDGSYGAPPPQYTKF